MAFAHKFKCDHHNKTSSCIQLIIFLIISLCAILPTGAFRHETWPWLAYIPSLNCTGAIVHSKWMITTSNCFLNKTIPTDLFIQVRKFNSSGKVQGVREVYVIDYTRGISTHGFTMLYMAYTGQSLTQNAVSLRAKNSKMPKSGILLNWNTGRANGAKDVHTFALSVDIVPCVGDSARHVCVFLSKRFADSSNILPYCSSIRLGSPLVTIEESGLLTLAGVLHEGTNCRQQRNLIGKFLHIDDGRKWIRQQLRIQDYPQCLPSGYRVLQEPSRDLRKTRSRLNALCDRELPRAWYRFKLDGQPAELPTACQPSNACGSSSSVWLPDGDSIELGQQMEIKACASWTIGSRRICCPWKMSVYVRHCGDFKVYRLRRTGFCPTAYCANVSKGVCGKGQTGYKPNCEDSYPKLPKVLHIYPFYAYQGRPKQPYVYVRCLLRNRKRDRSVRYLFHLHKIKQSKDGKTLKTVVDRTETTRSYFDVRLIPEKYPVTLGDTVICEVESFFQETRSAKSPVLASQSYHLGIKVETSSELILTYHNVVNLTFSITLPLLCHTSDKSCSLTIPLTTFLTDGATGNVISPGSHFSISKCFLFFTPQHCRRDKLTCGTNMVQIQAGRHFETSNVKLKIQLGPIFSTDSVWKDHVLPVIEAIVKPAPRFFCYSFSASNIRTFAGSFYKYLGEGTFLFYRSNRTLTEVQLKKWYCNGISTCPCAVAVREGNDVIVADMCYGQYKQSSLRFIIQSKLPLRKNTRILESNNGKSFAIHLPSGAQINIDEFDWGISIYLSVTDPGDGLCQGAAAAAQVTAKSLFDHPPSYPSKSTQVMTRDFCSCSGLKTLNQTKQFCPSSTMFPPSTNLKDITEKVLEKQQVLKKGFRLKRKYFKHDYSLQADGPSRSRSYEAREEICDKILNASDSLQVCKNILRKDIWQTIWQICVEEAQEVLDMGLLKSTGSTLNTICKEEIMNMKDNPNFLRRWMNELCENRCRVNDQCHQGNCKCRKGYGAVDCTVDLQTPPTVFPMEDALCDARNDICSEAFLSGSPFLNIGSLLCSFTPLQEIEESWKENRRETFTTKATYYSLRGVICTIPETRRSKYIKSKEAFHIRVSNNGYLWSNPVFRLTFDSLCQNCTGAGRCITLIGTCCIDSHCFINGDIHQKNSCYKCSPDHDPHKWTLHSDNVPPIFNSPNKDNITILLGDEISFVVGAIDHQRKPVKITHDVAEARFSRDGEFRWKPETVNTRTIQFLATDNCGQTTKKYVEVTVRKCPCRNAGECVSISRSDFKCSCPENFKGLYCEIKVSPCEPNPCFRGSCEEDGNEFRCICDLGYHGNVCSLKLLACYSNPCSRGKCVEIGHEFRCKCPQYYSGRLCDVKLSPCSSDPCARGRCLSVNDGGSFKCVCPKDFHGRSCSKRTTACHPNPCHLGRCISLGSGDMRCICPPKHHGKFCNITKLYCGNTRCINGACDAIGLGCVCHKNYVGKQCDIPCSLDCVNGTCSWTSGKSVCVCHAGYTGQRCEVKTTPCDANPCEYGICINMNLGHLCRCYPGYSGASCNISFCSTVNCNNGTCLIVSGQAVCHCAKDFVGRFCERQRKPCDTNPCINGQCIASDARSFSCSCSPGFRGFLCDERIDPCLSEPCGDGVCKTKTGGAFSCECPTGYSDPFCKEKEKTNPCHTNPCVHGQCESISDSDFRCKCESSFVGRFCEKRFEICASNPCVHGRCSSVLEGTFSCTCDSGFSGALCEIDHRPCSKKPCFPGVMCSNIDKIKFTCAECPSGYVGDGIKCVADKMKSVKLPCPRQFCYPGVQCSIVNSRINCGACPHGYFGNGFSCRVLCELPCQHRGLCVEPGVCSCHPGYVGVTCARAICKRGCLNGGRCIAPGKCRCPFSYFGERCEIERCTVKCMNGGVCIPPRKCHCLAGYAGAFCEQPVCASGCLNGGRCVKPGICRCLPGYFGTRCQKGTCAPQCRNGGICVRNNVCSCPEGYRGSHCQTAICRRECRNGGRCFRKDECSCPYGYWGDVCQHVFCLRPCMNNGVCIKPNVCLCPKDFAGVICESYIG